MHSLCDCLFNKLVDDMNKSIEECREIWKKIGCTLMTNWRIGQKNRTLIREVVLSIGPENVVHIVTKNIANYVIAGRLLEKQFLLELSLILSEQKLTEEPYSHIKISDFLYGGARNSTKKEHAEKEGILQAEFWWTQVRWWVSRG
ncbi:hypothetical protein QL285_004056 [Trifolium repens]|nr:hypothetical protein QL285_004056 [Trifolium repens]